MARTKGIPHQSPMKTVDAFEMREDLYLMAEACARHLGIDVPTLLRQAVVHELRSYIFDEVLRPHGIKGQESEEDLC